MYNQLFVYLQRSLGLVYYWIICWYTFALSFTFIKKGWTNYELDGIISKANTGEQVLLPIWHGITKQEVLDYSPSLADKVARNTASYTVEEIAEEITELING